MFLEHLTYGGKQKKKKFKNQPRNRHAVWTGFKILVMLQESEINLPWQNNIKDKKHDASSTTGSGTINGVHHSFMPLPKKKKIILTLHTVTLHVQTSFNQNSYVSCWWQVLMSSRRVNQYLTFHKISKVKQLRAIYFYLRHITILLLEIQRKQKTEKRATLHRTYQPKFLAWVSTPM